MSEDNKGTEQAKERLRLFIIEQRNHWRKLKKGKIPETKIIEGWIESCEFASDDLRTLTLLDQPKPPVDNIQGQASEDTKLFRKLHSTKAEDLERFGYWACDIIDRLTQQRQEKDKLLEIADGIIENNKAAIQQRDIHNANLVKQIKQLQAELASKDKEIDKLQQEISIVLVQKDREEERADSADAEIAKLLEKIGERQ